MSKLTPRSLACVSVTNAKRTAPWRCVSGGHGSITMACRSHRHNIHMRPSTSMDTAEVHSSRIAHVGLLITQADRHTAAVTSTSKTALFVVAHTQLHLLVVKDASHAHALLLAATEDIHPRLLCIPPTLTLHNRQQRHLLPRKHCEALTTGWLAACVCLVYLVHDGIQLAICKASLLHILFGIWVDDLLTQGAQAQVPAMLCNATDTRVSHVSTPCTENTEQLHGWLRHVAYGF